MRIYYKPVGGKVFPMDVQCTLKEFQDLVGGYFEMYLITPELAIVCNEDGRIKELPYNTTVLNSKFYGPLFLIGRKAQRDESYGWTDAKITFDQAVKLFSGIVKWRD